MLELAILILLTAILLLDGGIVRGKFILDFSTNLAKFPLFFDI